MTHGREKSDPAIVATKPANEAERSAEELAEPRAGAEGNAGQQSTRRTQCRVSVSHSYGDSHRFLGGVTSCAHAALGVYLRA
jgi:hypothetical protein